MRLTDYRTGEDIRAATIEEMHASAAQAMRDGGAGVIAVDGRGCYVAGDVAAIAREWRQAAGEAGDAAMVEICDRALAGDLAAQVEVLRCEAVHHAQREA